MKDIFAKLGDPDAHADAHDRLGRAYDGMLRSLATAQRADAEMAIKGAPAGQRLMTERVIAATTAAMTGNISAVRNRLGARVAEAMLMQIAADAGLNLTRRQK